MAVLSDAKNETSKFGGDGDGVSLGHGFESDNTAVWADGIGENARTRGHQGSSLAGTSETSIGGLGTGAGYLYWGAAQQHSKHAQLPEQGGGITVR